MITIIAAVAANRVIGAAGKGMLWRIPADMNHFVELTTPHPVLMGRKTYESIPAKFRPLKDRLNVVITTNTDYQTSPGVLICSSLDEALKIAQQYDDNIFVAGGGSIYSQAIDKTDRLEITEVHQDYEGDVLFPIIDSTNWKEVHREDHEGFSFVRYERQ
nr:Dihydrofolate reductase [uncultured bacterium]